MTQYRWWPLALFRQPADSRCIWYCVECKARCTREPRGHLDTHAHEGEVCPKTGAADVHVAPVKDGGQ